nr:LysR substrate-binding domain-containing protein [uncultured Cupriavidus sp.]
MAVPFDITDFRLFVNVAETSSLTRGAERSFLSVPAVSNRIKNLEDTLGVRLLERSSQGVTLTAAGEVYLQHARVVLAELERLTGNLQPFTTGLSGQVKLVANTTAITEYLPPVIGDYLATHPDVRIEVRERLSDDIVRLVREGGADLGIISGNVPTAGLQAVPFVKSALILVAPLGHPLLANPDVWFEQALDFAFVALLEGSVFQMFLTRAAGAVHKPMTVRVHVASYDAMCRMVAAGAGIAIMPKAAFARLKGQQQIGACNLHDDWAVRTFQLCARDLDGLSSFAREFANRLIERYAPDARAT